MTLENKYEQEPYSFYPEPPSASDALFRSGLIPQGAPVYDPAMGCGSVVRMARGARLNAYGSDLRAVGRSFLDFPEMPVHGGRVHVVTNPPYGKHESGRRIEELFVEHALALGAEEVYILMPLPWMAARVDWLKAQGCVALYVLRPRLSVLPFSEMKAGRWPGGGGKDYAWYRFKRGEKRCFIVDELHRNTELDTRENWTWWNNPVRLGT